MGSGASKAKQPPPAKKQTGQGKSEMAMKSALLIQNWYRRHLSRLEARRRYTWNIFQSLEYAGEQDQLLLYNFFNEFIGQITQENGELKKKSSLLTALQSYQKPKTVTDNLEQENFEIYQMTNPTQISVPSNHTGVTLTFPLDNNQIDALIESFKKRQRLHAHYVLELLHETRKHLQELPTVNHATTAAGKEITVCGDLHGKLDDLLIIFHKNGLPSSSNPYLFNGDFVDRGSYSVEVALLLFACFCLNPSAVHINRGNHEDHVLNLRYGFLKEIMSKYKEHATKIIRLFEDVFSWLPLATVIDDKVLVCHGGVSDQTDLDILNRADRHRYLSALKPPILEDDNAQLDIVEMRMILDILWSDPRAQKGCSKNVFRGGGCYWGPDVTEKILKKHNLKFIIRSHECKIEGYEYAHDNKVITIFSASNYYDTGSNRGAYIKMGPDLEPRFIQYQATKHTTRKLTIKQKVQGIEDSAMQCLKERIYSNKTLLMDQFAKYDPANMGLIKLADWCESMSSVLRINLPWRRLRPRLARVTDNGLIEYASTFEDIKIQDKLNEKEQATFTEALYRNKANLETIFRAIDKDNSGYLSMDEFEEACMILGQHTKTPIPQADVQAMARSIDINRDGKIDFNEFLEAFRIVDQFGKDFHARKRLGSTDTILDPTDHVRLHQLTVKS